MNLSTSVRTRLLHAALIPLLVLVTGCSKDKAEALRVAAVTFDKEARLALDAYEDYFARMIPTTGMDEAEYVSAFTGLSAASPDLVTPELVDGLLQQLSTAPHGGQIALADDFQKLRLTYQRFGSAFEHVAAGHLFSRAPVAAAAGMAAKLTTQLVTFRKQAAAMPSIDANTRVDLQLALQNILRTAPADAKEALLQAEARNFIALQIREAELSERVQTQFARAIIAGQTVCSLIESYDKLSVSEILAEISSKLALAGTISDRADVAALASEFDQLDAQIRADPFFASVIDQPVLHLTSTHDGH